jgi:hypothetical protein
VLVGQAQAEVKNSRENSRETAGKQQGRSDCCLHCSCPQTVWLYTTKRQSAWGGGSTLLVLCGFVLWAGWNQQGPKGCCR